MQQIFTVSELNREIKFLLESSFHSLWVVGEISNLRRPTSGHIYFTLKDQESQIRIVIFRNTINQIGFNLENGMNILCRGRLSVYHVRGEYQLVAEAAEPKGTGALQVAFEQLKKRLQEEGLFDEIHKKTLPFIPQTIGVVTSPTGAAIRDILNVTKRRFSSVDILIAPVRVQGIEAAPQICRAIALFNTIQDIDVIILARGGGSLEDLYPFNDERVARAIFASHIPVISAVGHEIDFTIADFVADLRAPTPSAAAELIVPDRKRLLETIHSLHYRLLNGQKRLLDGLHSSSASISRRLASPQILIEDSRLTIDRLQTRLSELLFHEINDEKNRLTILENRLVNIQPSAMIKNYIFKIDQLRNKLLIDIRFVLDTIKTRIHTSIAVLDSLSPLSVLQRGYSIVRKLPEKTIISETSSLVPGDEISVTVSRGHFSAKILTIFEESDIWQNKNLKKHWKNLKQS